MHTTEFKVISGSTSLQSSNNLPAQLCFSFRLVRIIRLPSTHLLSSRNHLPIYPDILSRKHLQVKLTTYVPTFYALPAAHPTYTYYSGACVRVLFRE